MFVCPAIPPIDMPSILSKHAPKMAQGGVFYHASYFLMLNKYLFLSNPVFPQILNYFFHRTTNPCDAANQETGTQ